MGDLNMFEKIRKCLDEFENIVKKDIREKWTKEEEDIAVYFNLRLAEALISDCKQSEKIARIILSEKGLFDDIEIKFMR